MGCPSERLPFDSICPIAIWAAACPVRAAPAEPYPLYWIFGSCMQADLRMQTSSAIGAPTLVPLAKPQAVPGYLSLTAGERKLVESAGQNSSWIQLAAVGNAAGGKAIRLLTIEAPRGRLRFTYDTVNAGRLNEEIELT